MSETNNAVYTERKRILFLGLPWTFTKYTISEDLINIRKGFFKTVEDDCYMYKVTDVKLETTLMEKMCGVGTVVCYTGDVTDSVLRIEHVKKSREIKDFILKNSEEERLKRRTLNTQNIGSAPLDMDCDCGHVDHMDLDD